MAVSTNSYFNNAVNGIVSVGADFNKFDMHSTPRWAIGTHFYRSDGCIFVYSHFGADTTPGFLIAPDASESSQAESANTMIAPVVTYKVDSEPGNIYPGSIGSHYIVATLASITADQFAGGTLVTTEGTGVAYSYRVKGNTATNDPATGKIRLQLWEPIQVAISATTDWTITASLWANLEGATAATDLCLGGVTCSSMDVSAKSYGYVQTKGPVGILLDGTVAIGDQVSLSDGVTGAVQALSGGGTTITDILAEAVVGYCMETAGTGDYGTIYLQLE